MSDYSMMLFPKASWKQETPKRSSKNASKKRTKDRSIMQSKEDHRCYLCMLLENNYQEHSYVEEHHVLFGALHELSDLYGLRVNLCLRHHREGREAVHNNQKHARLLMRIAQAAFIIAYPELDWMRIIGRNYWEDEDETTEETDAQI